MRSSTRHAYFYRSLPYLYEPNVRPPQPKCKQVFMHIHLSKISSSDFVQCHFERKWRIHRKCVPSTLTHTIIAIHLRQRGRLKIDNDTHRSRNYHTSSQGKLRGTLLFPFFRHSSNCESALPPAFRSTSSFFFHSFLPSFRLFTFRHSLYVHRYPSHVKNFLCS